MTNGFMVDTAGPVRQPRSGRARMCASSGLYLHLSVSVAALTSGDPREWRMIPFGVAIVCLLLGNRTVQSLQIWPIKFSKSLWAGEEDGLRAQRRELRAVSPPSALRLRLHLR